MCAEPFMETACEGNQCGGDSAENTSGARLGHTTVLRLLGEKFLQVQNAQVPNPRAPQQHKAVRSSPSSSGPEEPVRTLKGPIRKGSKSHSKHRHHSIWWGLTVMWSHSPAAAPQPWEL